jgi:hypothetical protein
VIKRAGLAVGVLASTVDSDGPFKKAVKMQEQVVTDARPVDARRAVVPVRLVVRVTLEEDGYLAHAR